MHSIERKVEGGGSGQRSSEWVECCEGGVIIAGSGGQRRKERAEYGEGRGEGMRRRSTMVRGEGEGSVIGGGGGKEGRRGRRVVRAVSSPVVVVSKEGRKERPERCGGGVGRQGHGRMGWEDFFRYRQLLPFELSSGRHPKVWLWKKSNEN